MLGAVPRRGDVECRAGLAQPRLPALLPPRRRRAAAGARTGRSDCDGGHGDRSPGACGDPCVLLRRQCPGHGAGRSDGRRLPRRARRDADAADHRSADRDHRRRSRNGARARLTTGGSPGLFLVGAARSRASAAAADATAGEAEEDRDAGQRDQQQGREHARDVEPVADFEDAVGKAGACAGRCRRRIPPRRRRSAPTRRRSAARRGNRAAPPAAAAATASASARRRRARTGRRDCGRRC